MHRSTAPSVVGLATVFGAGGGTSSYEEVRDTDLILLWGSNAREAGTWDESRQEQVTSPDNHDVTGGNFCVKGRFG